MHLDNDRLDQQMEDSRYNDYRSEHLEDQMFENEFGHTGFDLPRFQRLNMLRNAWLERQIRMVELVEEGKRLEQLLTH